MQKINKLIEKLYKTSTLDSLSVIPLKEQTVEKNPFAQFSLWFIEAANAGIMEPYTMALATAIVEGKPSVRMLLLKGIYERSFVFFSHYNSRKGKELEENPNAAMLFYWQQINKQVRIEGSVRRLSEADSDAYFQTRPRESQLNAWISLQSEVLMSRETLEKRKNQIEKRFRDAPVPRPPHWGGYRLHPTRFEFWQRVSNRFHDRIVYQQELKGDWIISRLFP